MDRIENILGVLDEPLIITDRQSEQIAKDLKMEYYLYEKLTETKKNEALLDQMAVVMADKLRAVFGNRVLGPDKPPVARIQTLFIKKIVVKIEQNAPMGRARELLLRIQRGDVGR